MDVLKIETTTDWSSWTTFTTLTNSDELITIRDAIGTTPRFYRAVSQGIQPQ